MSPVQLISQYFTIKVGGEYYFLPSFHVFAQGYRYRKGFQCPQQLIIWFIPFNIWKKKKGEEKAEEEEEEEEGGEEEDKKGKKYEKS